MVMLMLMLARQTPAQRGGSRKLLSHLLKPPKRSIDASHRYRFKSTGGENPRQSPPSSTEWPLSLASFVAGTPIITREIPLFGRLTIDFGTTMMNFGAITSLSGFMMTNVLALRTLSIVGSLCGITYNITRTPRQLNAVGWGCVFISVNLVQILRLLIENAEVKFSVEEGELYYRVFAPSEVEPKLFVGLMKLAEWKTYKKNEVIVPGGEPLHRVHILVQGTATSSNEDEALYTYSAADNGSIIGGTAIVDPSVLGHKYPNTIRANETVRVMSFDTKELCQFLEENDSTVEAALLRLMYVDLFGLFRQHRRLAESLETAKNMLKESCKKNIISPKERREIREYVEANRISVEQFRALLEAVGWSEQEWKDGAKHSSSFFFQKNERSQR